MPRLPIDLDVIVDVGYSVDSNPKKERMYPIDIESVKLRGTEIYHMLDIHHIVTLQRRTYNRLVDSGEI